MVLQLQALISQSSPPSHTHLHLQNPTFYPHSSLLVSRWNGARRNWRMKTMASQIGDSNASVKKKRNIVEHVSLLKAKSDLSDKDEKDMLDFLYTVQYYMRGILAVSLGRISNDNVENYTHAVFMRFQRKDDVAKFYENPFYLKVLNEHVFPHCHGLINVDFESEVEDDIIHIFRKGEDFNYGVELLHLITFSESAYGAPAENALASFGQLAEEFPSLIVQSTQGSNFNPSSEEYTHAVVTRLRSLEAFDIFMSSTQYKDVWKSKFDGITKKKTLLIHFSVDPVGKELM